MRILLTGANGFIGRQLLARLQSAGHEVVPAVRRPEEADALLPSPASIRVDFNRDVLAEYWLPRLAAIDAVINCAGVLQGRSHQSIDAIHTRSPIALFQACALAGVRRVIQISAISADEAADTDYARSKRKADIFLASSGDKLDWVILRPSLVYAQGAYGGTALMRGLAALPFVIPVAGDGRQAFQPIHVDDLADTILHILETPELRAKIIDPVGPDRLSLRDILVDLRRWLGFGSAPVAHVPLRLIRWAGRLGDIFGGTINSTSVRQMEYGNSGDVAAFTIATGIKPRRWADALRAHPAQTQDRWHARLYFVRPMLRIAVATTWVASGLIGLFAGDSAAPSPLLAIAACAADIAIGLLVFMRWRTGVMALVQLALVAAYTLFLTVREPLLWLDPFGPLLKNLPFAVAVLALAALEPER